MKPAQKIKLTRVNRAKKGTQEFFTPDYIIDIMLENIPEEFFQTGQSFHESCCGNGNILVKVYNKFRKFHDHKTSLSFIHAFDYMPDNVVETISRLYGPGEVKRVDSIPADMQESGLIAVFTHNGHLVRNIVCADGLIYKKNYGYSLMPSVFGNGLFEFS
jgi:hypothetical protein